MKRKIETIILVAIIPLAFFALRLVALNGDQTLKEYDFLKSLNIVEEKKENVIKEVKKDDINKTTEKSESVDRIVKDNNSSLGNSNDSGAGDGSGDSNSPKLINQKSPVVQTPIPTAVPQNESTKTPTNKPTTKPTSTPSKEDPVVSIECEWPDKYNITYGDITFPLDTLKVYANLESGKKKKLASKDYEIQGLRSVIVGKHKMYVYYKNFQCKLTYKVNNYLDTLMLEWDSEIGKNGKKLYKNEIIDDIKLRVIPYMANGDEEDDLELTDYDIVLEKGASYTEGPQRLTVLYNGVEYNTTCQFNEYHVTIHSLYYNDSSYSDLAGKVDAPLNASYSTKLTPLANGAKENYSGNSFLLKKQEFSVNGGGRGKFSKAMNVKRNFQIDLYRYFVKE